MCRCIHGGSSHSRMSTGKCPRNVGGISDFAVDAGEESLHFHIFTKNSYVNVCDFHKNRETASGGYQLVTCIE